jgi:hypothetical protein
VKRDQDYFLLSCGEIGRINVFNLNEQVDIGNIVFIGEGAKRRRVYRGRTSRTG